MDGKDAWVRQRLPATLARFESIEIPHINMRFKLDVAEKDSGGVSKIHIANLSLDSL